MSHESHAISSSTLTRPAVSEAFAARFASRPAPTVESRAAHQPRPANETLDAGQCRIWLNECRREIDRLRMGLEVQPETVVVDLRAKDITRPDSGIETLRGEQRETLSDPPTAPKLYAVTPLAEMPERRHPEPTEPPAHVAIITRPHVTNVGTLLDVFA